MPFIALGSGDNGADDESEATGGTAGTLQTTIRRIDGYAWDFNCSASFGYREFSVPTQGAGQSYYPSHYFQIKTLPSADSPILWAGDTGDLNTGWEVRLKTTGRLGMYVNTGAGTYVQVGSDSAILSLDTWYRLEMTGDWDDNQCSARIDGTDFCTNQSNGNTAVACTRVRFGMNCRGGNLASGRIIVDDFLVFDGGTSKTAWVGEYAIKYLRPNGAGQADTNVALAGSSPAATAHESMDEVIANDGVDYIEHSNNAGGTCDVAFEDLTGAASVKALAPGARCTAATSGTNTTNYLVGIAQTAAVSDSAVVTHGLTTWWSHDDTAGSKRYKLFVAVDPGTSAAWTVSGVNSATLRVRSTDSTPRNRVTQAWVAAIYVPTAGGGTITGVCRIEGRGESRTSGTRLKTGSSRVEATGQQRAAGIRLATGLARVESRTDASGVGSALKVGSVRIEGRGEPRSSQGIRYASGLVRLEGRGVLQPLSGNAYLTGLARIEGGGFIRISPVSIAPTVFGIIRIESRSDLRGIGTRLLTGLTRIEGRSDPGASGTRVRTGLVRVESGSLLQALGVNIVPPVPARVSGRGEIRVIGRAYRSGIARIEGRGRLVLAIPEWEEGEDINVFELLVPMILPDHVGQAANLRARFLTREMTVRTDLPGVNPVTGWLQNTAGPPVVTYFHERGSNGCFFFSYPSYPNGEVVGVEVDDGDGGVDTVYSVNPAEMPTRATGARTVIRTVKTSSAGNAPVLNALLTLKGPTGIILDRNYVDSGTGEIRWALDDNLAGQNYTVSITAPGFSPVVDEPLTVAGNSLSGDLLMNPIVPTPVAGIEFCSIDGQLIDGFGEPVEGMAVTAEPDPMPMWVDTALIGGEKRESLSLPDGTFNLQLIRGKSYRIVVPLWGVDETLPVPDVANTTLKAMLESVGITSQEIGT